MTRGEPQRTKSFKDRFGIVATGVQSNLRRSARGRVYVQCGWLDHIFNARAAELWGREPKLNDAGDRYCGSLRLFSTDGRPIAHEDCWMSLALRDGKSCGGHEIVVERADGSRRTVLAHISPLFDDRGNVVGAINVLFDVTEQRRAELARARRAAIVDSSDDAIVSKNLDGVIQSWNAAAERLFGYTSEEAVGRHISFLIPPDRGDEEDGILARIRSGERVYHFDTVRIRSDGEPIDISVTISPIRNEVGQIVGASKIARDISDRKRAEEQVYGLLTQLNEADRRKDEFLAILAHELRNPLVPLCALLETIKRQPDDAGLLPRIRDTMERQIGQISRLVDDLLDASRTANNKLQLRLERVELAPIVAQAVETCNSLAERAKHRLEVDLPSEPVCLHADRARLIQVFSNLLNNACRYTDDGGIIRLTAERHDGEIAVSVKDNGIGIPPAKLAIVFDMFAQVHAASEPSRGGLGIGLNLVKRLVEMHGGSVQAKSDGPGRGSEFIVRLPICVEAQAGAQPLLPGDDRKTSRLRRVLVVDDNVDSAASLATLLRISGMETATAHDGPAALAAIESLRPDAALLDISLPKMDGHEVARRVRAQPWGKDIRLVALTGWGQPEDRRRSKDAGFDEHMVKPADYEALMKYLASV